jgi:Fe-S cluster assembly protein SufD
MATELKLVRTPTEDTLITRITAQQNGAGGKVLPLRRNAAEIFARNGLPNRRVEAWKYTDLKALMTQVADPTPTQWTPADVLLANALHQQSELSAMPLHGIIGASFKALSDLPQGVTISLVSADQQEALLGQTLALAGENAAVQLNTALMDHAIVIRVGAGLEVQEPLHLGFIAPWQQAVAMYPRVVIMLEKGASLTVIEHHISENGVKHQINSIVELHIADDATCEHIRVNAHGDQALVLSTLGATLGKHARLNAFNVVSNPAVSRHQVFVTYAGDHADAIINGVALLKGTQHADSTLVVDHAEPHGTSRETFKTVLDGSATGVFQGQIQVKSKAQKTDGRMSSNALMLSDDATMYNKPELEIFADDVQCAHGATCGALDDDLLFYLLARGIARHDAEGLMVQAFVGEALEPIQNDTIREALMNVVEKWVTHRRSA